MKRGLIVTAALFSLTACSSQQVEQAAGWTAGAAVIAAATGLAVYGVKKDLEDDCDARCRQDKQRRAARRQAGEERRTAQRIAELDAALDGYLTAEPDVGTEERSVVIIPDNLPVPQRSVDRLNAALPETAPEE